ncbi:MAG: hypothetical protein SGBAC_005325 [Bacillariaceae sp.]
MPDHPAPNSKNNGDPNSTGIASASSLPKIGGDTDTSFFGEPILTPFFIGSGLGTTGTTALYNAMCFLGFPSVHFRRSCIHPLESNSSSDHAMTSIDNRNSDGSFSGSSPQNLPTKSKNQLKMDAEKALVEKGLSAHKQLIKCWRSLRACARRSRQNDTALTSRHSVCSNFTGIVDSLDHHAAQVVASGVALVTDTPYPFLVDFLQQVALHHRPNTVIVLTERDPEAWVQSRLRHHIGESDLMCWDDDKLTTNANAFDLHKCLKRNERVQRKPLSSLSTENDPSRITMPQPTYNAQNLAFQHSEIVQESQQRYRSMLAHAMEQHQTRIKKHFTDDQIIVINLWTEDLPTVPVLAQALWTRMQPFLPTDDIIAQYKHATPLQTIRS